jgi:[phosphatase 2A protein]-leucine-carboxy methyltransferase
MASDDAVRATNDDAAQCKRFAVEKGYWKDPFISLLTQRSQNKHAPEINLNIIKFININKISVGM